MSDSEDVDACGQCGDQQGTCDCIGAGAASTSKQVAAAFLSAMQGKPSDMLQVAFDDLRAVIKKSTTDNACRKKLADQFAGFLRSKLDQLADLLAAGASGDEDFSKHFTFKAVAPFPGLKPVDQLVVHNVELQDILIKRLKLADYNYVGAVLVYSIVPLYHAMGRISMFQCPSPLSQEARDATSSRVAAMGTEDHRGEEERKEEQEPVAADIAGDATATTAPPPLIQRIWRALVVALETRACAITESINSMVENETIEFGSLAFLLTRGHFLRSTQHSAPTIMRVSKSDYISQNGVAYFTVDGNSYEMNARGRVSKTNVRLKVCFYNGSKTMKEMDLIRVSPDDAHAQQLQARGERIMKFVEMKEFVHCAYDGDYLYVEQNQYLRCNIQDRIMLDKRMYGSAQGSRYADDDDAHKNDVPETKWKHRLFLLNPYLSGYDLHQFHRWGLFHIDSISDIVWNENAFDRLILPAMESVAGSDDDGEASSSSSSSAGARAESSTKDAIRALVENFQHSQKDLVQNKNSGLIGLLHGGPGTGKTLSAEVTAEHLKRPLYYVSAGSLGLEVSGIENQFKRLVKLSKRWNAIMLLDESDTFLESRAGASLERNAIVGCFLRVLESFTGILFMTTNRCETFDPAVKSRVHIMLKYSELSEATRHTVWGNMLKDVGHPNVKLARSFIRYASVNGRQLRTIFTIAQALARHDGKKPEEMTEVHVERAARLNGQDR